MANLSPAVNSDEPAVDEKTTTGKTTQNGVSGTPKDVQINGTTATESRAEIYNLTIVEDAYTTYRRRIIKELEDVEETYYSSMTLDAFLEHITQDRLIHLPQKGSKWDKVLTAAEYFALQIHSYGDAVDRFLPGGHLAASFAIGSCQILLKKVSKNHLRISIDELIKHSSATIMLKL